MQSASPTELICPNPSCRTPNPLGQPQCQSCHTRLPLMVLYAPDLVDWAGPPGNGLVGDRYGWRGKGVLVDHKPGLVPDAPDEVPMAIAAYLRLFDHRPHVPTPYGQVIVDGRSRLLLEGAPVTATGDLRLPPIRQEWSQATALRQLNWLYQLAQLWDPLRHLQCERTLLDAQKICVEGGWIRLLSLDHRPSERPLKSVDLIREWVGWADKAHPSVTKALQGLLAHALGDNMGGATIATVIQDWAIQWAAAQPPCPSTVAALTDPGPSRDRNEDACYPPSGQGQTNPSDRTLAIVCDGLGGHDAGEVASDLAIQTFQTQLGQTLKGNAIAPGAPTAKALKQTFLDANHQISQQNDQEEREDRHRMGTTAVVTLQQGRLLHAASLGDSRIYRLTAQSCHQITSDDDLASREVRLGYGFYRDISQAPTGGALVQALGMGSSEYLSPGIRPLLLDEDCLFLLCSDGVSDFDFVERYASDIYGFLQQGLSLDQIAKKIVQLATQVNGHDNTTAALVHVQGNLTRDREVQIPLSLPDYFDETPLPTSDITNAPPVPSPSNSETSPALELVTGRSPDSTVTELATAPPSPRRSPLLVGIILIAAGLLAALLWPTLRNLIESNQSVPEPASPTPITDASPSPPPADPLAPATDFSKGQILRIDAPLPGAITPTLRPRPRTDVDATVNLSPLQTLIVDDITNTQDSTSLDGESWVKVSICGALASPGIPLNRESSAVGWIERSVLMAIARPIPAPTAAQQDACTTVPAPLPPSPTPIPASPLP